MATGVIGYHGRHVAPPVEKRNEYANGTVIIQHLNMVEHRVKENQWLQRSVMWLPVQV